MRRRKERERERARKPHSLEGQDETQLIFINRIFSVKAVVEAVWHLRQEIVLTPHASQRQVKSCPPVSKELLLSQAVHKRLGKQTGQQRK